MKKSYLPRCFDQRDQRAENSESELLGRQKRCESRKELAHSACTKHQLIALIGDDAQANQDGFVLSAEAVNQSSNSLWGARQSGSKSLSPLVNGKA